MSENPSRIKKLIGRLLVSPTVGRLANLLPLSWMIGRITGVVVRSRLAPGQNALPSLSEAPVTYIGLRDTLQSVTDSVVDGLGYVVALVATYEADGSLPIRAITLNPEVVTLEQVRHWENEINEFMPDRRIISDPDSPYIGRVYVDDPDHAVNLSVQAVKAGHPVRHDELYTLFAPFAPLATRPSIRAIQAAIGLHEVLAVPFFIESRRNGKIQREVVGNLFTGKTSPFTERDIDTLMTFGQQAASAIKSERRGLRLKAMQGLTLNMQSSLDNEDGILQQLVDGVVHRLGYIGAMVATYDPLTHSLPLRAISLDQEVVSLAQIDEWVANVNELLPTPLVLTDTNSPHIIRTYLHDPSHQQNPSVRSVKEGRSVIDPTLYALFDGVVPAVAKPIIDNVQALLKMTEVVSVPIFIETPEKEREIIGTLYTSKRGSRFSSSDIEFLQVFAQQAAVILKNARLYGEIEGLYEKAEQRRQIAEVLGRMAFNASTSVHELRNRIGSFMSYCETLQGSASYVRELPDEVLSQLPLELSDLVEDAEYIDQLVPELKRAAELLDNLHQPLQDVADEQTDVNVCLLRAAKGQRVGFSLQMGLIRAVHNLTEQPLPINTAPSMLTEAFRIVVNNAIDAMLAQDDGRAHTLTVTSYLKDRYNVVVLIKDTGCGIPRENLEKLFQLRWTTKKKGLGFGLFWAKDYIEGLNGKIFVDSQLEQGTTFTIQLPIQSNKPSEMVSESL